MISRILTTAAAIGLFAGVAYAGDFEQLDADGSGGLSLAEVQAAAPSVTTEEFAAFDADGSGELSMSEFDQWKAAAAQPQE
jgi:hypothetical protein